jgi:hypothetical protein
MKRLTLLLLAFTLSAPLVSAQSYDYLGELSANPYLPDSTSNQFGIYGSPYSYQSIHNEFGPYGSPYSPRSVTSPFAVDTPLVYAQDGTYLGRLSANRYDPESISNPFGPYGSHFSATSVNNPFSLYGSPYSIYSATNPYATLPPIIVYEEDSE